MQKFHAQLRKCFKYIENCYKMPFKMHISDCNLPPKLNGGNPLPQPPVLTHEPLTKSDPPPTFQTTPPTLESYIVLNVGIHWITIEWRRRLPTLPKEAVWPHFEGGCVWWYWSSRSTDTKFYLTPRTFYTNGTSRGTDKNEPHNSSKMLK